MTCFSTFMMMILVDLLSSGFYMEYVGGKVLGNGNGYQYSEDTLKKYQKTW